MRVFVMVCLVVGLELLASDLLDLTTGATVACTFGLVLLLWSGILRVHRLGRAAGQPALHSGQSALTYKGARR